MTLQQCPLLFPKLKYKMVHFLYFMLLLFESIFANHLVATLFRQVKYWRDTTIQI